MLEADVALPVVKDFIARVRDKAVGAEVVGSLTPGQAFVGVVHRELAALMGGTAVPLDFAVQPPAVVLHGGSAGLGQDHDDREARAPVARAEEEGPASSPADVYRPAAIEQLATLAQQVGVDAFPSAVGEKPVGDRGGGGRLGEEALPRRA